jgi:hypothetical protein
MRDATHVLGCFLAPETVAPRTEPVAEIASSAVAREPVAVGDQAVSDPMTWEESCVRAERRLCQRPVSALIFPELTASLSAW